ncbi:hypothetical protein VdG1_01413 [Verticillium dahliae VDG1]|nr:hypothetical protein VdG1_01413 [Verticillium dahliae VDG1]
MAQLLLDLVTSFGNCLSCFPGSPTLKINNRSFKILRLLGEGGFSYVYLVEDTSTQAQYALKKIRCPFGAESVAQAMREVDAYRLFGRTPGIIHAVDHASIRNVVRRCLTVEPAERPDIDELIAMVEKIIDELPGDGEA